MTKIDVTQAEELINDLEASPTSAYLLEYHSLLPQKITLWCCRNTETLTHPKESGYLLFPFPSSSRPALFFSEEECYTLPRLSDDNCHADPFKVYPKAPTTNKLEEQEYTNSFNGILSSLSSGKVEKVVLSRQSRYQYDGIIPSLELFRRVVTSAPNMYVTLLYTPSEGWWLSATPELFLRCHNNYLETMALAGTQEGADKLEAWSPKNKQEQTLVQDYIIHQLYSLGITPFAFPVFPRKANGNLYHLETKITAHMNGVSPLTIAKQLFPTPAVCGVPQATALETLKQFEGYDRGYYSGILGRFNSTSCHLYVHLRSASWTKDKELFLYAGGGVMPSSSRLSEWEETEKKMDTIRASFKL